MLESQTRVPQEGDGERRSATDAREPGPKRPAQREDVDRAEVRELAVLDVAPNLLDGIQLWSVARQSFDRHPRPLLSEILPITRLVCPPSPSQTTMMWRPGKWRLRARRKPISARSL